MLQREQVSGLVGNELVEVDKTVEKDADLSLVLAQLVQREVPFNWLGLDHVVHLTQQVHEENWFVIQVLQSVALLLIEVVHLVRGDRAVVV